MEGYKIHQIRKLLKDHVLEVCFTKADGSERVMKASTNSIYIPKTPSKAKTKITQKHPVDDELITCRDIELNAWRSFRFDSLISFTVLDDPVLVEEV